MQSWAYSILIELNNSDWLEDGVTKKVISVLLTEF